MADRRDTRLALLRALVESSLGEQGLTMFAELLEDRGPLKTVGLKDVPGAWLEQPISCEAFEKATGFDAALCRRYCKDMKGPSAIAECEKAVRQAIMDNALNPPGRDPNCWFDEDGNFVCDNPVGTMPPQPSPGPDPSPIEMPEQVLINGAWYRRVRPLKRPARDSSAESMLTRGTCEGGCK